MNEQMAPAYPPLYTDTPSARYQRDRAFKELVDMMTYQIHTAQFSPSEMRDAALLASIHYESLQVRSRVIYVDPHGNASTPAEYRL